jgi:1-deoxy-D-xylulose-5-phosphate reductoisomerase
VPKRLIIVGATGSIGRQTIDVVKSRPGEFEVVGLSAHSDLAGLLKAAAGFPGAALALSGGTPVAGAAEAAPIAAASGREVRYLGPEGLDELIRGTEADIVVNGAAGSGGLGPSLAAVESGKDLALANKESVVMAWRVLERGAAARGSRILPVDSEHAALFQLLERVGRDEVEELVITASGGAFRDRPLDELDSVRPDEAAAHPNWSMGRKITIDSATMANKGLEVIEASRLFGFEPARIKVLVHPQSLVHALVRTRDGSLYAQVSEPDMRVPIQNALTWPEDRACAFGRLELAGARMEFREAEAERYPMLGLAYDALAAGEGATVAYNAADEAAVAAFEAGSIRFTDIAGVVARALDERWPIRLEDLRSIFDVDAAAREAAAGAIGEIGCC